MLPDHYPWVHYNKSGNKRGVRLACCQEGCVSFGIFPSGTSKKYVTLVLGKSESDFLERTKKRTDQGAKVRKESGCIRGENNPMSKSKLSARGLSPDEVTQFLKTKARKNVDTKRNAGFFDDKSNNPFAIEFWLKKGLSEEQAQNKINERIHNKPEFWQTRGYSPEEALIKATASAATNSLEEKIRRHGEEKGREKYAETQKKLKDAWSPKSASGKKFNSSRQADRFFLKLYKFCRRLGYDKQDIVFKLTPGGEYFFRDESNIYFYDFMIRPLGLIFEFNGEHVHPRKDKLTQQQWVQWKHAFCKYSADEAWKKWQDKKICAEKNGYSIIELWSKDENNFEKATQLLKEYHERKNHKA